MIGAPSYVSQPAPSSVAGSEHLVHDQTQSIVTPSAPDYLRGEREKLVVRWTLSGVGADPLEADPGLSA